MAVVLGYGAHSYRLRGLFGLQLLQLQEAAVEGREQVFEGVPDVFLVGSLLLGDTGLLDDFSPARLFEH